MRFRLLTFAGVEYMVQAWQEGENHWLRLQASIPVVMETESEEGAGTAAPDARQTEVDAFNDRAGAWIFQIPEYKYSTLTKRLESLLKPLESDEANSGG